MNTISKKNCITPINIAIKLFPVRTIKVTGSRFNKFAKSICATFVFLTTYLPKSTCRLFAKARWRCPIQSVWSMLSWLDCDSNPVQRFAKIGGTRWNLRVLVPSSQMIPGSRSNKEQFWPESRWLRNKLYRVGTALSVSSSLNTRRERIYPQPLQNRTKSKGSFKFRYEHFKLIALYI